MIKAVIFDMDGVISDTQKLHSRAEHEILSQYGIDLSPEQITERYAGVRTKEFFKDLLDAKNVKYDLGAVMKDKWSKMETMANESIDPVPGIFDLLELFKKLSLPMAVASASDIDYVNSVLKSLGVESYFSAIIGGDMVNKGKPDPGIFLLAAEKLGIAPNLCLVIEDGKSGMEAARRADMYCVGLVSDTKNEYPTKNKVLSLSEINEEFIHSLESSPKQAQAEVRR